MPLHPQVATAIAKAGDLPTDLTPADLTIREGGRERAVATLEPATGPLQISILVDDAGQGFFEGPVIGRCVVVDL